MAGVQKKFVIKSFKNQYVMDANEAQKTFATLENAIDEIYNKNASELRFEELYRSGYNLVLNKHGNLLYNGLMESTKKHLISTIEQLLHTPNDLLLSTLANIWNEHKTIYNMIKDIMMYVDRTYVIQHRKQPVYNMAVLIFRENIFFNIEIRDRVRNLLLNNIESERNGCLIDRGLMKEILCMLGDFSLDGTNVYEEDFERFFLTMTKSFYHQEAQNELTKSNCPEYIIRAENRLQEETDRVRAYLSFSSEPKLRSIVEHEYITCHAKSLIDMENNGAIILMKSDRLIELKKLYKLFAYVPSTLDCLRESMGQYISQYGVEIVNEHNSSGVKDPVLFVQKMIEFKTKFDTIIKECYNDEKKFYKKLKESFENFINKDDKCASYLASYADDLLKSFSSKGMSESDVDEQFNKVMTLFKYLNDKDIFEGMYRNHFSKRLLNNKSASDDLEKLMISKLKSECGQQFTSKIEGMFLDMNLGKEIMDFFSSSRWRSVLPFELDVQTLTASHWSMKNQSPCLLPPQAIKCCDFFNQFYLDRFGSGRRLTWLTHVGTVDMKVNFPLGRRELNVSTYQMCILMQFNDRLTLSLDQIRTMTGITPESELRRHLLSLCTPKIRILKKSSSGKGIENDDQITFNEEFTSKFRRIKIPLISVKEVTLEESEAVTSAVEEDRRHLIEAAIVRIMKARRRLSHTDLLAEATKQLSIRFQPTPLAIKKRVESLIEREYLARDKDDTRYYNYLA